MALLCKCRFPEALALAKLSDGVLELLSNAEPQPLQHKEWISTEEWLSAIPDKGCAASDLLQWAQADVGSGESGDGPLALALPV